jgi:L-lactate dehydrogenase (cytochrome)
LRPNYLKDFSKVDLSATIFDKKYNLPFGIAPIGLQGLIWPGAPKILAKAAKKFNIPYILSTVSTEDIESIAEVNEDAWFQLYNPVDASIRDNMLERCEAVGVKVLVVLADVPAFGYRPKEIRNGLAIPPKMTLSNMWQIASHPHWALATLMYGAPQFKMLKPYLPSNLSLKHLGMFMNQTFDGRLNEDRIKAIREKWKGKMILKGVASIEDANKALQWGVDGLIISNHGGRQLDAAESTIDTLRSLSLHLKSKTTVMVDSGIRNGVDVASMAATGADFTFLGRSFMYGVGAMSNDGGDQVISILGKELTQVMQQIGCERIGDLGGFLL